MENTFFTELFSESDKSIVYNEIRRHKNITKFELFNIINIKRGTLTRILEELVNAKLLKANRLGDSTGGRRPIIYSINESWAYTIGIDLSRNYIHANIQDLALNPITDYYTRISGTESPEEILSLLHQEITKKLDEYNINKVKILGIGVGCFGPVDKQKRVMINPFGYTHKGWKKFNICDYLEELFHISVFLDNGANNALRAEYWTQSNHLPNNIVYMHINEGFRSSMLINKHIISGSIGQMIIQSDGIEPDNPYGNFGSLHAYVTKTYILKQVKKMLKQQRQFSLNHLSPKNISFKDVEWALNHRDPLIEEIILESSTYLGIGLSNIINVFHPQVIIFNGDLIKCNAFFDNAIYIANKKLYKYATEQPLYIKSKLDQHSIVQGSGIMVLDRLAKAML